MERRTADPSATLGTKNLWVPAHLGSGGGGGTDQHNGNQPGFALSASLRSSRHTCILSFTAAMAGH